MARDRLDLMQFVIVHDGAKAPMRHHPGDAGWDLSLAEPVTVRYGAPVACRTGILVALPPSMWGLLVGRSSAFKDGITVQQAVIDAGYRGELLVYASLAQEREPLHLEAGRRIAQLVPIETTKVVGCMQVTRDELRFGERGSRGYGSTGR